MTHEAHPVSAGQLPLQLAGIVAAAACTALLVWRIFAQGVVAAADGALSWFVVVVVSASAVGYLVADFGSGVVHFTFDRFFSADTPILGKNFVLLFRTHHSDPVDITRHGFVATNGNNCLAALPVLLLLVFGPFDLSHGPALFFVAMMVAASLGTFATNQFHKWAHATSLPRWVDWLQRHHLILPRGHHRIHHTFPYESHYCITTGWLNGALSRIDFWRRLGALGERVLRMPIYCETVAWEQQPGSIAASEHTAEWLTTTQGPPAAPSKPAPAADSRAAA